jgi:hypothetical protein
MPSAATGGTRDAGERHAAIPIAALSGDAFGKLLAGR